ncbi:MAG: MFS transporter [Burkholderiales bacterium]|nr:MFS transporter [Burkholderiales bacterium]
MSAPGHDGAAQLRLMTLLALTAFVVAGAIHYQTPMLAAIGADLRADAAAMGWVPTLSFAGMFAGVVLLVPLGDRIDKRTLILVKIVLLCAAQALMAAAPSIGVLAAASFVTGVCSSLIQSMVAIVAEAARPNERGRAVGTLLTALSVGILFARIMGGVMASHFGWRSSYVLSTLLLLAVIPLLAARLPHMRTTTAAGYRALMRSMLELLRGHADIRRAAAIQFMLGISYGGFWAVLSPMVKAFHDLSPAQVGLIGIPGAAGILIARAAGKWTDRSGPMPVVATAVCTMLLAWCVFSLSGWSVVAVVAGAILLDCALRSAMVANQTLVNTAVPGSRARANTVFGTHVWAGNAIGAFLFSRAFAHFGWAAVCAVAATATALALWLHFRAWAKQRSG